MTLMKYPVVIWKHGPNTIRALKSKNGVIDCEWEILGQLTTRHQFTDKHSGQMSENFMIERCRALDLFNNPSEVDEPEVEAVPSAKPEAES